MSSLTFTITGITYRGVRLDESWRTPSDPIQQERPQPTFVDGNHPFLPSMKHHLPLEVAEEKHWTSRRSVSVYPRVEDCEPAEPAGTVTERLNTLLHTSGPGYTLRLCPRQTYLIQAPLSFGAPQQEISTLGYPTGDERATLVVSGPVANGLGHSMAVDGAHLNCSGVKLRNIQIDGARRGAPPIGGGGNIEMGGEFNTDQLVEYVHSYDPRGWSCLHVAEGSLNCNNATVQNNDIGPCGSDTFQEWADGISMACPNSVVRNNMIQGATDGGIVLFGAPGTQVYNNTIWIVNSTLLGGINMVDYLPFYGNYTGTTVKNNTILGSFATSPEQPGKTKGSNSEDIIIKIGIAIGPRTWFGDKFGTNFSYSGIVSDNRFSGAFGYAIAIASAKNFTVVDNLLIGNTSFIGIRGPNCSSLDVVPNPAPFIVDPHSTEGLTLQLNFENVADGDALTCILPPLGGDEWPYGVSPSNSSHHVGSSGIGSKRGAPEKAGIAVGVIVGFFGLVGVLWYIRNRAVKRERA